MLKNSKGIKAFSVICHLLGLAALGYFIYVMVKTNGNFTADIGFNIALIVAAVMFSIVGIVLNPPKLLNTTSLNFVLGIVLFAVAGLSLALIIYTAVTQFVLETIIINGAIFVSGVFFGTILFKIAKQDVNVNARIKSEQKALDEKKAQERASLTACPYCGCRLQPTDEVCPNCKSKL